MWFFSGILTRSLANFRWNFLQFLLLSFSYYLRKLFPSIAPRFIKRFLPKFLCGFCRDCFFLGVPRRFLSEVHILVHNPFFKNSIGNPCRSSSRNSSTSAFKFFFFRSSSEYSINPVVSLRFVPRVPPGALLAIFLGFYPEITSGIPWRWNLGGIPLIIIFGILLGSFSGERWDSGLSSKRKCRKLLNEFFRALP